MCVSIDVTRAAEKPMLKKKHIIECVLFGLDLIARRCIHRKQIKSSILLYTQNETDGLLNLKSNASDTYNTTSVNLLLNDKLDTSTYNTGIALKANSSDVYNKSSLYTKTETSTLLGNKVDNTTLNNYYTQLQINNSFTNYYTKTYIDNEFGNYYLASYIDTTISDLNDDINLKFDSGDIANYYNKTESYVVSEEHDVGEPYVGSEEQDLREPYGRGEEQEVTKPFV